MDPSVVQEGDQVVFRRGSSTRVFQIRRKRQVYFEKSKFNVDELIGQPYGSTFEIDRGKLIKVEPEKLTGFQIEGVSSDPTADNRNLHDTETNQKMSKDDIMKMKDDGMTGEKIIEELVENSETFRTKTEFSQAKYLKKKKQKHLQVFTVLRPTPRLVMEIFSKDPAKICYLRQDTLSQILSYSNVMYGSSVGVVETCQGLVLACVLQRIGGQGKLIQLIPNATNAVCRQVMDYLNFPKDHLDNVYSFPMDCLNSLSESTTEEDSKTTESVTTHRKDSVHTHSGGDSSLATATESTEDSGKDIDAKNGKLTSQSGDAEMMEEVADVTEDNTEDAAGDSGDEEEDDADGETAITDDKTSTGGKRPFAPNREKQRKQRALRQKEAGEIIRKKKLDSLILACKYNPTPILMKMLEFMSPSRPVVVYCQFLDPLVECYTQIKEKHIGLQLKLSETWFREYQVLPQRTHPMMNMSGTGGYLLTFMTAQPGEVSRPPS